MGYGLPTAIHNLKVSPWTVRLTVATKALNDAVRSKDRKMAVYYLEDTSFWMGRVTCDAIGAAEGAQNFKPYRSAAFAVMNAAEGIAKAKTFLTQSRPPLGSFSVKRTPSNLLFLAFAAVLLLRPT